jgi:hypothetical protein
MGRSPFADTLLEYKPVGIEGAARVIGQLDFSNFVDPNECGGTLGLD